MVECRQVEWLNLTGRTVKYRQAARLIGTCSMVEYRQVEWLIRTGRTVKYRQAARLIGLVVWLNQDW